MVGCDTPLLLSLASQKALGGVIRLPDMRMELQTLNTEIPLLTAGNHLAISVDDFDDTDGANDEDKDNKP
eukprot:5127771-Prorocentrum_lima.AAC.1